MIPTFSMPARRSTSAVASAERCTSSGGKPLADILGMRTRSPSVRVNSSTWLSREPSAQRTAPFPLLMIALPPAGSAFASMAQNDARTQPRRRARVI